MEWLKRALFDLLVTIATIIAYNLLVAHFKDNSVEIDNAEVVQLKREKDSLINYSRSREQVIVDLKKEGHKLRVSRDSAIIKIKENGKVKKISLSNTNGNKLNSWNDSVLRSNNIE